MQELIDRLEGLGSPRILLVGDFMLDRYVFGDAERLSPEAPVPVLNVVRSETRPGGAANAAAAMIALGAKVVCVGLLGQDQPGEELKALLSGIGAQISGMVRLGDRPTTIKTRYVGLAQHRHPQQMLRVDTEASLPVSNSVAMTLRAAARGELKNCRVLAIEDYNKGALSDAATPQIIDDARKAGLVVIADPARISDFRRYRGTTVITPNRYEAELASGIPITDDESLQRAARAIMLAADAQIVVVKLDKEGAYLLTKDGQGARIPTRPRWVYDVTGAGDEVLAMLAVALAKGCPPEQAAALANVTGGLEVERFGAVPVTREEVLQELRRVSGLRGGKVMARRQLAAELAKRRRRGERIVFTNGCFDLLHMGHLRHLRQARQHGACLVVAINSDESVRRLKGPSRPVIGQDERAEMLSALECVDYVTVFDEDTPENLLKLLRPNLLVKGGTTDVVVGREIVEGYGGQVLILDKVEGLSTTRIIDRIVAANDGGK
jgi:D-beta-D-heptose 7-phosphate kinase/D-beta-D-heptose 1-phosphate adenosyltransferase